MDSISSTANALPSLDGTFTWIVLTLLGISTVLFVADSIGLLPGFIRKYIMRNRAAQTIDVLRDIGFDVERVKRQNRAAKISEQIAPATLVKNTKRLTDTHLISRPLKVGRVDAVETNSFIDLMGATCDPAKALDAAQKLSAHWRNIISDTDETTIPDFDFVAAPKSGSPLIAYEFAKLHRKPLVLHNETPKFVPDDDFEAQFDAAISPPSGSVGLIVDDSTTGGRKGVAVIQSLRDAGYEVHDFLVLFEPLTKQSLERNAKIRLKAVNVRLHSIIETE